MAIRGNFYQNFFEQVAEGYKNLLSFNHSLIKGTFQNFIFKFPNFLREENLSTVQTFQKKIHPRYLSRKSLLLSTKCQLFPFSSLPPFEIFYILSTINRISHAVSQQISPHSRDDNPFAESRKRGGGQQAERGEEVKVAAPLVGATAVVVERHYERGKAGLMSPRPANATQRRYL